MILFVLLGLLAGILSPLQASITRKLKGRVGSLYYAGEIGYLVAAVTAFLLFLLSGMRDAAPLRNLAGQPFWMFLGGPLGILFITGNVLLIEKIGGVQMVIFPALGQILMGLVVDHYGLFRSTVILMTPVRLLGGVLVLFGVVIAAAGGRREPKMQNHPRSAGRDILLWQIFGVIIGALHSFQTAFNGYFGKVTESPLLSTALNFTIGAVLLTAICLVLSPRIRHTEEWETRSRHVPFWVWLGGGVLGAVIICLSILTAGGIGTGMAAITYLSGSSIAGILIDHFGLLGAQIKKMTWRKTAGVAVMIGGAALCHLAGG